MLIECLDLGEEVFLELGVLWRGDYFQSDFSLGREVKALLNLTSESFS